MNEEKQAIEYLKARLYGNEGCYLIDVAQSDLRIFLNLVENQQKEIEYLKEQIPQDKIFYYSEKDYISKDKIREKIKELEKKKDWFIKYKTSDEVYNKIEILEELLGE